MDSLHGSMKFNHHGSEAVVVGVKNVHYFPERGGVEGEYKIEQSNREGIIKIAEEENIIEKSTFTKQKKYPPYNFDHQSTKKTT